MSRGLSWRSPKTRVAPSPIHGRGLFATQDIEAGEIVAIKGGYIYEATDWATTRALLDSGEVQIGESFFIAPADRNEWEGAMLFTNHSCEPNIGVQGQIVFVAMRGIARGEELTHDWCTTDNMDYEINCRCGSPHCRGVVTGRDWMRNDLQRRYRGWFAWHIQRIIDAQGRGRG